MPEGSSRELPSGSKRPREPRLSIRKDVSFAAQSRLFYLSRSLLARRAESEGQAAVSQEERQCPASGWRRGAAARDASWQAEAGSGASTESGVIRQLRSPGLFPGSCQDSVSRWSIAVIRSGNSEPPAMKHAIITHQPMIMERPGSQPLPEKPYGR